ncbi:IS1-like element transposase [Escherichia coli]
MASVFISCPSCSATDWVVRTATPPDHVISLSLPVNMDRIFTRTAFSPVCNEKLFRWRVTLLDVSTARIMGVGLNTILRHLKNSGRSR